MQASLNQPDHFAPERWPRIGKARMRREYELASRILVASDYAAQTFVDQGVAAEKLSVIYRGVDAEVFKPPAERRTRPFIVASCGALGERKGTYELIRSWRKLALPDAPFANGGYATPSGKCEFYSAALERSGISAVPDYLPNYEPPTAEHPLAMISPPARNFMNSTFVNVQKLRSAEGRPLLEMHPDDAAARQIADGDAVRVFNQRGDYVCHASINGRARAGVVVGLGIWWRKDGANGTNVNELTHQQLTDIGRAPSFYDCAVQVARCA